ncbi:MAG: alpha-2-macroglobulin, partial [Deltaproteobacteria bacterium]|nr:alpha-2-macroglobulin [Deltaproteobacteria bacterium]
MPYFLQVNTLDEDSQLKRAGRLIHQSVISLEKDATLDLNQWNSFALELSSLIKPDPGAIYRIELGFDQSMSAYPCASETNDDQPQANATAKFSDGDFWDTPDDYYSSYPYYYDEDWNWRDRDDPCTASYYTRSRWVSRNLLASDLGIIAKGGTAGTYHAYVTDLRTTEPVSDVEVELLSFQMQPVATGKTSSDGSVVFETKEKPFLLVAKKGNQKGYLRLDDGRQLSLSRFDVSGQTVPKGLKGYLYGERGVWRPGDSLFISFIPEDRYQALPANHPVTFELINPRGQLVHRQVARHPENRIYSFRMATDEEAVTGFWLGRVIMGDALFEQTIRIETIKPNRLRIDLDFGTDRIDGSQSVKGELFSEWLHGALASNLKSQITLSLAPSKTTFKGYNDFSFDNTTLEFESDEVTIFEGNLDGDGKAGFSFNPKLQQEVPGMLRARFTTRVFEEGGSFSIDRFDLPFSPYSRYVGIR